MERSRASDPDRLVEAVNADTRGRWTLRRRLNGGANGGAYLVCDAAGAHAVLKVLSRDTERVIAADRTVPAFERAAAAANLVDIARRRGWPTPEWYAFGQAATGETWTLQEFIEGAQPPKIDARLAEQTIEIFELQRGMLPDGHGGWDAWITRVMFEGWEGLRARVQPLRGGQAIVSRIDAIAESCAGVVVRHGDLVHGDLNLTNMLATERRLLIIDVDALNSGPRLFDLSKVLLIAGIFDQATPAGLRRLWSCAERADGREFALCFGAAALKIAEGVVGHGLSEVAPVYLSKIAAMLDRVRPLV